MAPVEQLVVAANAIAARMALYASRAMWAREDGDIEAARHWTRRREHDEVRLAAAKRELADARRRELLRVHRAGGEG